MKVYTKKGDSGKTSLICGKRVLKTDDRIVACGTIDELSSYLGVVHDSCEEEIIKRGLRLIQGVLFVAGSHIVSDSEKLYTGVSSVGAGEISSLECTIDYFSKELPRLNVFVPLNGNILASHTHVARSICRRAERDVLRANDEHSLNGNTLAYLNRLSDYLFVLARYFASK